MPHIDDSLIVDNPGNIEIVNKIGRRKISHVIHDIDGTHSLIREWPPVMSLSIHWAMTSGLEDDFDSDENVVKLIGQVGRSALEETDQFCVESAGLSALTQMEYGIRRAVELGNIPEDAGFILNDADREKNARIAKRIWNGEERFGDMDEPKEFHRFIDERTPRLFKLYEKILNGACRDANTADAWNNPEKWRVPGSLRFMDHLHRCGCINYFVTGAVIYEDGGMYEEVQSLGFDIGSGKMVEALKGSSWDRKLPKNEVITELLFELGVAPKHVLVIGDGRSEIEAGIALGCVAMSRLDPDMHRQRELHIGFGTNYIVPDFSDGAVYKLIGR